jgi:hypothetical protein
LEHAPPRKLTSTNIRAKHEYERYITQKFTLQATREEAIDLLKIAKDGQFTDAQEDTLNAIDDILSSIMLNGAEQCSKRTIG